MSHEKADYAVREQTSRGREHPEQPHPYRSAFERDRDRVIHSSAFRRLEGKTQVFTPGLDDYYRTRLTHTIEVAQIGRTIAKALRLNESLAEAICLAHDLGHSPFGHAGEKALNELTAHVGGFEHNRQSLRIVDLLEHPYPAFYGLNLTYETRLALAKHTSTYDRPENDDFDEPNCTLEGQIAGIADRIAYNCHDLEDGMRGRLINTDHVKAVSLVADAYKKIGAEVIEDHTIRRTRTAKAIIDRLVSDCIETSQKTIAEKNIKTLEDVYACDGNLIRLSEQNDARLSELEEYLMQNFYLHAKVRRTSDQVREWLGALFERLRGNPELMPGYFRKFIAQHGLDRSVCDYIAGMTDRFAISMIEKKPDRLNPKDG